MRLPVDNARYTGFELDLAGEPVALYANIGKGREQAGETGQGGTRSRRHANKVGAVMPDGGAGQHTQNREEIQQEGGLQQGSDMVARYSFPEPDSGRTPTA